MSALSASGGVAIAGPGRGAAPAPSASAKEDAGPSPEARAANAKALDLSRDGHYAEALEQFQRAYDLSPSYVILYNIGRMARLTQDFARSLTAFQRYLRDGGIDIDAARRSEVEQEIASLTSLVSWVRVQAEAGARISVDGHEIGVAPIDEKIPLNPGARTFRAEKAGASVSKDLSAKAGAATLVVLDFAQPKAILPKAGHDRFRFPPGVVVTAWVATGVFTAASVGTGAAAVATSNSLQSDVYVGPARAPNPDSAIAKKAKRVDALATATNALIAGAVVTGTAAIAFTIVDAVAGPAQDHDHTKDAPKPAALRVDRVDVGVGSVFVTGSF